AEGILQGMAGFSLVLDGLRISYWVEISRSLPFGKTSSAMTNFPKSDDLFRQATKAWETAAEAGVKMQEECAKWVQHMFCESSTLSDWYEKGQKVMSEAIAKSQENV